MENNKITIGNVCFLLDKARNEILLLKRSFEPMKAMYTGVGGKTSFNEDINASCIREVKEETGLDVCNLQLKGIIKTILDGRNSSWILFIYLTTSFTGQQIPCPEGELKWVKLDEVYNHKLIGFIREIMPYILNENGITEGTIWHDRNGEVLSKSIVENEHYN